MNGIGERTGVDEAEISAEEMRRIDAELAAIIAHADPSPSLLARLIARLPMPVVRDLVAIKIMMMRLSLRYPTAVLATCVIAYGTGVAILVAAAGAVWAGVR